VFVSFTLFVLLVFAESLFGVRIGENRIGLLPAVVSSPSPTGCAIPPPSEPPAPAGGCRGS